MQLQNLYDVFVFLLNAIGAWHSLFTIYSTATVRSGSLA